MPTLKPDDWAWWREDWRKTPMRNWAIMRLVAVLIPLGMIAGTLFVWALEKLGQL